MATFFVDDGFPEHPKAVAAGEAACWLYVCGLAYVKRNATVGLIPKPAAHRLTTKGPALAKQLVRVGLWHDQGDSYEIHDYRQFNAKSIEKSAKAAAAARARWAKQTPSIADADADALQNADADASDPQCPIEPENQRTISSSSSTPVLQEPPAPRSDDDPRRPGNPQVTAPIDARAYRLIAERRMAGIPNIHARDAYLRTALNDVRRQHEPTVAALDLAEFTSVEQLADYLEPAAPPAKPDPLEATQAAGRRRDERAEAEARARAEHPCPDCDGGLADNPDGGIIACASCSGTGAILEAIR